MSFRCLWSRESCLTRQTTNGLEKHRNQRRPSFTLPSHLSGCSAVYLKPCQALQHIRCPGELRHLGSRWGKSVWVWSRSSSRKAQLVHVSPSQQPRAWQRTVITTRAQSESVQESKQASAERECALLLIGFGCRLFSTCHTQAGFNFIFLYVEKMKLLTRTWLSLQIYGCNVAFRILMQTHCRSKRVKVLRKGQQQQRQQSEKKNVYLY